MKKGFVSMAVVYTFLIIFLVIMVAILNSYINRSNFVNKIVTDTKVYLNEE